MSYFTELEDVIYSVVEYIPLVGTVYSLKRAGIAYSEHDWKRHWLSVANFLESSIRDVVLFGEVAEPTEVVVLHTMAESFTDKMIDIYHNVDNKPEVLHDSSGNPRIKITKALDKDRGHVLVAESSGGKFQQQVFRDKAKGVHHFHGAVFTGTLRNSKYAPDGETIRLDLPRGLYDGARATFSWRWTRDYWDVKNRPEATLGWIRLEAGTPTKFGLSKRKGAGWEPGYDFWGEIRDKDTIVATTEVDNTQTEIVFQRVSGT